MSFYLFLLLSCQAAGSRKYNIGHYWSPDMVLPNQSRFLGMCLPPPPPPSLRPKVWVGAGLGLGLREGRVGTSPGTWIDPFFQRVSRQPNTPPEEELVITGQMIFTTSYIFLQKVKRKYFMKLGVKGKQTRRVTAMWETRIKAASIFLTTLPILNLAQISSISTKVLLLSSSNYRRERESVVISQNDGHILTT